MTVYKPWKYHKSFGGEAEKSVYKHCMQLWVAQRQAAADIEDIKFDWYASLKEIFSETRVKVMGNQSHIGLVVLYRV